MTEIYDFLIACGIHLGIAANLIVAVLREHYG